MLDIQFIRDNPDEVQEKALQKGYKIDVKKLLAVDKTYRQLKQQADELRAKRNDHTATIQGKPTDEQIATGKAIKDELVTLEDKLAKAEAEVADLVKVVPNMPLQEVPVGTHEDENVVIKTVGTKLDFDFEPKTHGTIGEAKGWIDKERAAKVAGARFVYLKGDLARLEFALWQFGIDTLTNEDVLKKIIKDNNLKVSSKPFEFVLPPAVAKTKVFEATGRLNKEEQTYKLEDDDLWLNASAEHTLAPMFLDETLDEAQFPIRFVGYTTAFRREAGTYGKDTDGIFRLHQFNKLEMESFNTPEESYQEHLFLIAIQEYLMQQLKLPYQVLEKCTADIGFPNAKGVDINTWLPGQNNYRETHTADYITDFQTRSMRTKVKRKDGATVLAHTNDATAFSERPLAAIIENYQTKEGNVRIPKVLQPYMGNRELLK